MPDLKILGNANLDNTSLESITKAVQQPITQKQPITIQKNGSAPGNLKILGVANKDTAISSIGDPLMPAKIAAGNIDQAIDADPDIPDTSKAYLKINKFKMTPEELKHSMDVFAGRTEKQADNTWYKRLGLGVVEGGTTGAILGAQAGSLLGPEGTAIGAGIGAAVTGIGEGIGKAVFGDNKNYYLDNKGIPQPLAFGEKAPAGTLVEDAFGDTIHSNALVNAGGRFINAITKTGAIVPTVLSTTEKLLTGKDGMFTKFADAVNQDLQTSKLHANVDEKGIVNGAHIKQISDLLDSESWNANPTSILGLVGDLASMVVTFGGVGKVATMAGDSLAVLKTTTATTAALLGGHLESAKQAGLTPREQAMTATVGALGEALLFHMAGTATSNILGQTASKEGIKEITDAVDRDMKLTRPVMITDAGEFIGDTQARISSGLQAFMKIAGKKMDGWLARYPKSAALNIGQMEAIDLYNHGVKQIADATFGYDDTTKTGFHDSLTSGAAISGYLESAISGSLFGALHNPTTTDATRGKVIFDHLINGKKEQLIESLDAMKKDGRITDQGYDQAKSMIMKYKEYQKELQGGTLAPAAMQEIMQNSYEADLLKTKSSILEKLNNATVKGTDEAVQVVKNPNGKGYMDANKKGVTYTDDQVTITPRTTIEEANAKAVKGEISKRVNKVAELMSGAKSKETTIREDEHEQATNGESETNQAITDILNNAFKGKKKSVVAPTTDENGDPVDTETLKKQEEPEQELGPVGKKKKDLVDRLTAGEEISGDISKSVGKTANKQFGSRTGTGFDFTTDDGKQYDFYSHKEYHDAITDEDLKDKKATLNLVPEKEGSDGKKYKDVVEVKIGDRVVGHIRETEDKTFKEKEQENESKKPAQPTTEVKKEEKQEAEPAEVKPVITEEQEPEPKKKSDLQQMHPDNKGIEFSVTKKIKAVYDRESKKFRYFNSKGRQYNNGKQLQNLANKLATRAYKTWHTELASDEQKQKVNDIIENLRTIDNKDHTQLEYSMKSVIMRNIRNVLFSPIIMKDLTDVNAKKWSSDKGFPLDTFVTDHLLNEMREHGFSGDEQDLMNDVREVIMDYPEGIKFSDIKKEDKDSKPLNIMDEMSQEFTDLTGLGLTNSIPIIEQIYEEDERRIEKEAAAESETGRYAKISETDETPATEEEETGLSKTAQTILGHLDRLRIKPTDKTFSLIPPFNFAPGLWNTTIDVLQAAIRAGDTLAQAISKGIKHVSKELPEWWAGLNYEDKQQFKADFREMLSGEQAKMQYLLSDESREEDIKTFADSLGISLEPAQEYLGQYGDSNDRQQHDYNSVRYMWVDQDTNIPFVKDMTESQIKETVLNHSKTFKFDPNNIRAGYYELPIPELVEHWKENPQDHSRNAFDRMYVYFNSSKRLANYHVSNIKGGYQLELSNPVETKVEKAKNYTDIFEQHSNNEKIAEKFPALRADYKKQKAALSTKITNAVSGGPKQDSLRRLESTVKNAKLNNKPEAEILSLTRQLERAKEDSDIMALINDYTTLDADFLEKVTGISSVDWRSLAASMVPKEYSNIDEYYYDYKVRKDKPADSPLSHFILNKADSFNALREELTKGKEITNNGNKFIQNQFASLAKETNNRQVTDSYADSFEDVKGKRVSSAEGHGAFTLLAEDITKAQTNPLYKDNPFVKDNASGMKIARLNGLKNDFTSEANDLSKFNPHDAIVTQLASFLHSGTTAQAGTDKYFQFYDQQSDSKSKYLISMVKRPLSEIESKVNKFESKAAIDREVSFIQKRLLDQTGKGNIKLPQGTTAEQVAKEFVYNYAFNKYYADEYFRTPDIHKPGTKLNGDYRMQIKRKIQGAGDGLILGKDGGVDDTYRASVITDPEVLAEIKGVFSKKTELTDGQILLMPWHNDNIGVSTGQKYKGIVKDFHYQHLDGHEVMMKGNGIVLSEALAKDNPVLSKLLEAAKQQAIDRFVFKSSAKLIQPEQVNKLEYVYSKDGKQVVDVKVPAKLKFVDLDSRYLRIQQDLTNKGTLKEGKLTTQIVNIIKQLPEHKQIEQLFAQASKKAYEEVTDEFFNLDTAGRKEWFAENVPDTPENIPLLQLLNSKKGSLNDPAINLFLNKVFGSVIEQRLLNLEANKALAIHGKMPGINHESMKVGKDKLEHPEGSFPAGMERTPERPNGIKAGESAMIIRVPSDNFHSTSFFKAKQFLPEDMKNTFIGDAAYQVSSGHDNDGDGAHIWTQYRDKEGKPIENDTYKGLMNKVYDLLEKAYIDPKNLKLLTNPIDTNQVDPYIKKYQAKENALSPNMFSSWLTMFDSNRQSRVVVGAMANGQKVTYNLQSIKSQLKKAIVFPKFDENGKPTGYNHKLTGYGDKNTQDINATFGNNLNQALDDPKLAKLYAMGVTAATVNIHNLLVGQKSDILGDVIHFLNHPVVQTYNRIYNEAMSPTSTIDDIFHQTAVELNGGRQLSEESVFNKKVWEKGTPPTKDILDTTKRTIAGDLQVLNYFQYLDYAARDIMTLNKVINLNDNGIRSYGQLVGAENAMTRIVNNKLNVIDIKGLNSSDAIERARHNIDITRKYYNETLGGSPVMKVVENHIIGEFKKINPKFEAKEEHLDSIFRALHEFAIVQGLNITKNKEQLKNDAVKMYDNIPDASPLKFLFEVGKDDQLQLRPDFKRKRLDVTELKKYQSAFSKLSDKDKQALLEYQVKQYGWTKSTKLGGFFPYIDTQTQLKVSEAIDKVIPELNASDAITAQQIAGQIQRNNTELIPEASFIHDINKKKLKGPKGEQIEGEYPQMVRSAIDKKQFIFDKQQTTSGESYYNTDQQDEGVTPIKNIKAEGYTHLDSDKGHFETSVSKNNRLKFQEPMNYPMPKAENIHGKDTNTFDLITEGLRTSTTRSYWHNVAKGAVKTPEEMIGKIVTFLSPKGQKIDVVVDSAHQVTLSDRRNPEFMQQWSDKEGWTKEHLLKETKVGDWQIQFHLADKKAEQDKLDFQTTSQQPYLKDDPAFREFVYEKIQKQFPDVQIFKDPIAFQEFLDKHFPGEQLDFTKLGAAIGNAFWINQDSARQDTQLHEAAHIFWDMLPANDSVKVKMLSKFGSEEAAVDKIGLAATEKALNEFTHTTQSWLKSFWNKVRNLLWGKTTGEAYIKIMAERMFSNDLAAHTNELANHALKYYGGPEKDWQNREEQKKWKDKIEKQLGKDIQKDLTTQDVVNTMREYVPLKQNDNAIIKNYEHHFGNPLTVDGKVKVKDINDWTRSHYAGQTFSMLENALKVTKEGSAQHETAKYNRDLANQKYEEYLQGVLKTKEIIDKYTGAEHFNSHELLYKTDTNTLKKDLDTISAAFNGDIDDHFSDFAHQFIGDYYVASIIKDAIRGDKKNPGEAHTDYKGIPVFTRMLYGMLFEKDSPDWIEGFKGILSGHPKFISPTHLRESVLQAWQKVRSRAQQNSSMDAGRYMAETDHLIDAIEKSGASLEDLIYRPSVKNRDTGDIRHGAIEFWINDQMPETKEQWDKLQSDNSEKGKALKEFLKTHKKLMNELSPFYEKDSDFYKVRQSEDDDYNMIKRHGLGKTLAFKSAGEKKFDDICISYPMPDGTYGTLKEAKDDIIAKTDKGLLSGVQSVRKIRKLTREAENLYYSNSPFDTQGRLIQRNEKIGPDAAKERGANKPIGLGGISTVKNEFSTTNRRAALHQYIAKVSFQSNMEMQRPILNFFENYAGRREKPVIEQWLKDMNSSLLYHQSPDSILGRRYGSFLNWFNNFTAMKFLALNLHAPQFNLMAGMTQNFRELGVRNMMVGFKRMTEGLSIDQHWGNGFAKGVFLDFLHTYQIVDITHAAEMSVGSSLVEKGKQILFSPVTYPEYLIHGLTACGNLTSKEWSSFKQWVKEGKNGKPPVSIDRILDILEKDQKVSGSYHALVRKRINATPEGRALMSMKNWLPDIFDAHFLKQYQDIYGNEKKGIFWSTTDTFKSVFLGKEGTISQRWANLPEVDKENLNRVGREMSLVLAFAMVGAAANDDKENQQRLSRMMSDIGWVYDIENYRFLLNSPVPAFKAAYDALGAAHAMLNVVTGDQAMTMMRDGKYALKGESKAPVVIANALPGAGLLKKGLQVDTNN